MNLFLLLLFTTCVTSINEEETFQFLIKHQKLQTRLSSKIHELAYTFVDKEETILDEYMIVGAFLVSQDPEAVRAAVYWCEDHVRQAGYCEEIVRLCRVPEGSLREHLATLPVQCH